MLSTKTRTTIIALVASASFAAASLAPAVSQAQWHTICYAGHCTTHQNYTVGGVDPCTGLNSNYGKAYEALLEAIETKKEQADKVHPEMTQSEAQAKIDEAEAQVHLVSIAAFEWGCAAAARTSPTSVGKAPVGTIKRQLHKAASPRVRLKLAASSLSVR
jgi:hypothetical protein